MSDVVNAELLRLCDEILHSRALYQTNPEAWGQSETIARALKSRLQAEAPEDAEVLREVMLALEDLSFECFSPIAPCNPPSVATYSRTFDVLDRHRKARGWATVPKTAISKPRTSQAEAQAPTTAALTEDERAFFYRRSFHISSTDDPVEIKYRAIIDRLTVGAPAPQCMPDDCKGLDTVEAYRQYYRKHKKDMATWKNGTPDWFNKKDDSNG